MTSVLGFLFCKMLVICLGRGPGPSISLSPCLSLLLCLPTSAPRLALARGSDQHRVTPHPATDGIKPHKIRLCERSRWHFSPFGHSVWCSIPPSLPRTSSKASLPGVGFPEQQLGALTQQNQQHEPCSYNVPNTQLQFILLLQGENTQQVDGF